MNYEFGNEDLPEDFIALMRSHLGDEQAESLFRGLQEPPSVAVRFNPRKIQHLALNREALTDPVPWCPDAYYLSERKAFTFDPLFHAGAYYVQDASSMYLAEILRKYFSPLTSHFLPLIIALDLCAAPGGKSTLLASLLPEGSTLISNEPIRKRAQVLAENMQKWGSPTADGRSGVAVRSVVTQNYPDEFGHFRDTFDLILADVPCSGEGMFRKDPVAIREWSLDNVRQCAQRQRDILRAIVPTLRPGGLLVYSTCTFNRFEDEEQVQWLVSEYGLQLLEERHFFPGRDRGEGLYIAALRRTEGTEQTETTERDTHPFRSDELRKRLQSSPSAPFTLHPSSLKTLNVIADSLSYNSQSSILNPQSPNSQSSILNPQLELSYPQAIAYLRREALHVAAPRGIVCVTYRGLPLGLAKSVGTRLNNLYPQEWRIRTTYNPTEPLPDFFLS